MALTSKITLQSGIQRWLVYGMNQQSAQTASDSAVKNSGSSVCPELEGITRTVMVFMAGTILTSMSPAPSSAPVQLRTLANQSGMMCSGISKGQSSYTLHSQLPY